MTVDRVPDHRWPSACWPATPRAIARAISLIEDEATPPARRWSRDIFRAHRPRLSGRHHRAARRRQEHAGRSADRRRRGRRGETRRRHRRRSDQPVHRRRDPRRSRCACRRTRPTTGVFIRSMATRGHLGGLARATGDAALVLDAAGKSIVIIETVGVGQDEVDIVRTADISIVVLVPGTGDDVQALKAGIMEIADIFVVNKAIAKAPIGWCTSIEVEPVAAAFRARASGGRRSSRPRRRPARASPSCGRRSARSATHSAGHARQARAGAQRVPPARAADAPLHGARRARRCSSRRVRGAGRAHRDARARSVHRGRRILLDAGAQAARPSAEAEPEPIDESRSRSRRHRRRAISRPRWRSIATRSACEVEAPRGGRVAARARALHAGRASRRSSCSKRPRPIRRSRSTSRSAAPACITSRCASTTSTRRWRS